jgi:hypothetical protein
MVKNLIDVRIFFGAQSDNLFAVPTFKIIDESATVFMYAITQVAMRHDSIGNLLQHEMSHDRAINAINPNHVAVHPLVHLLALHPPSDKIADNERDEN